MKKAIIFILLLAALLPALPVSAAEAGTETKTEPSDWARAEVAEAIGTGFVPETLQSDWTSPITRGEFAELAVRYLAALLQYTPDGFLETYLAPGAIEYYIAFQNSGATEISFYDGTEDFAFADADGDFIKLAHKLGIIFGVGDNLFAPDREITREEAAAMLLRTHYTYYSGAGYAAELPFEDADEISEWAMPGVRFAVAMDVMRGYSEARFAPKETYTREQAVVTFRRLFGQIIAKGGIVTRNPASITAQEVIDSYLNSDWQSLLERFDTEYGTVLHMVTGGIPHAGGHILTLITSDARQYNLLAPVPRSNGWGIKVIEHLTLSEDGRYLHFDISFATRAADLGKLIHEAGTYYFETDLAAAETVLTEFVPLEE